MEIFLTAMTQCLRGSLLAACFAGIVANAAPDLVPPPLPDVPPFISHSYDGDQDRDRIEDRLFEQVRAAETARAQAVTVKEKTKAQAQLDEMADLELIFDRQITQKHLDDFLAQGGEVTHLYQAISYGWNGRLPLGKIRALVALMGDTLVQIEQAKPAEWHLDNATRTGRVRPIWAAGFAGNVAGFDGNASITIGAVDTGVDESHTDLNGRRAFWHDYSSDGFANPVDVVQHGTHVLGIALGTGAASGSATGNLLFTDEGDLSGVPSGSFFPSPINLPATSITVNIVATWQGGGSTTLYLLYHTRGVSGGWTVQGSGVTGTSPLTLNLTFTPSTTRAYSAALISNGSMSGFATTVSASGFASLGDGFNKLRGVAPACNWAEAKAFSNAGSGSSTTINAGIDGLVANRVANNIKVMNISLGITGDPGISTSQRQKVNTAVNNGIVVVCSAGNDGLKSTTLQREMDDPGRAAMALTVAAANDINQLTDYTSSGFSSPSATSGVEEDYKPDLMAPGGSANYYSSIMSVDSNSGDGVAFPDQRTNDYYNIQGTSMASPFAAGCAALVIDALQQAGTNWSFSSSQHPRLVKMLLCATASESNANRDSGANNPTLQRNTAGPSGFPVGKDPYEGFGMINPDAAIEAAILRYTNGTTESVTLGGTVNDRRVWARMASLPGGASFSVALSVPGTGDFDLYLYSRTPSAYGTPVLLASSALAGNGVAESINYTPATATNVLLVVKRVSGSGTFNLVPSGLPTANFTGAPTSGSLPLTVAFNNTSSGATSYAWTFGDGNASTNTNPSSTYTNPGTYSVTLTAFGAGGSNVLTRNNYVVVTNPPPLLASFTANPTSGAARLLVNFANLSTGATDYSWDFGNGLNSSLAHPSVTYSNAGVYSVTLAATGPAGTDVLVHTNYILVTNAPPAITSQPQAQAVNIGGNASFNVAATGTPPLSYQWRLRGTNIPSAAASSLDVIDAQITDAGDYSVVVSNVIGSVTSSPATLSVIVMQGVIPVTGSPYLENFDGMGAAGTTPPFGWYVGTGTGLISGTNVTVGNGSANGADNYNFGTSGSPDRALGSLAANSTQRDTEARFINVSDFDLTAFTISYTGEQWRVGGNGAANNDLILQFSTDGVSFVSLGTAFNFNTPIDSGSAGALDGNSAPNRVTGIGGTYTPANPITSGQVFYLRWSDADNTSLDHALAIDDFAISFALALPQPEAGFIADTTSGVAPLAVQFTNLSSHATAYAWDFGDGETSTAANPSNTYSNAGSYTVTLTATSSVGTNTFSLTNFITVTNYPPVIADFAADFTSGLAPLTVAFTNLSANAMDFVWDFGDGNTSTNFQASNTYTNAGSYNVALIASGPGGTNTLTRTNYVVVTNIPPLLLVLPASMDFGPVLTGSVAQAELVVSNAGGLTLNATASLLAAPFSIFDDASNAVTSFSFAVPVNTTTNLSVHFAPDVAGSFSNAVIFVTDGGNSTNSITGLGFGTPVIVDLVFNPPDFTFSFETVTGKNYVVQFKDALEDAFWQTLPAVPGDGTMKTITNLTTTPAQRFYRLSVE